jgi:hypothetical protein
MPYVETGEFANVGVLLWAPKKRYLGFKLLRKKYGRITQFFEELDKAVYLRAMHDLDAELVRVQKLLLNDDVSAANVDMEYGFHKGIFEELIRPRETIVRFSEQRVVLAEDPVHAMNDLYDYYVGRNFVTKEYQETILEKGVKKLLKTKDLVNRYHRRKVQDNLYGVTFPFVQEREEKAVRVIKPLFLGQADSTKIIEHGDHWKLKVQQLRKRRLLHGPVLFPIKGPDGTNPDGVRLEAFEETMWNLEEAGIDLALYTEHKKILDFAAEA